MVDPVFDIVPVDEEATEDQEEQMGTKRKFWLMRSEPGPQPCRWLFKYSQDGTGQDWAEKIACELAEALAIPHAQVELAHVGGQPGCLVKTVLEWPGSDTLEHGNQVLYAHDPRYPRESRSPADHTVERVLRTLDALKVKPPQQARDDTEQLARGSDWFVGYLMLDALIGNTDRHHENWAVVQPRRRHSRSTPLTLSASFDHGSSLGRELRDEERARRLREGWATAGVAYALRARSGLYETPQDRRPLHPVAAFALSAKLRPEAGRIFRHRLGQLLPETMEALVERLPAQRASAAARRFMSLLLQHNRAEILALAQPPLETSGPPVHSQETEQ